MKVLTRNEIRHLKQVRTLPSDAETILKRNTQALKLFVGNKRGTVDIGCPHCLRAGAVGCGVGSTRNCPKCDYCRVEPSQPGDAPCLTFTFGGVKFYDVADFLTISSISLRIFDGYRHCTKDEAKKVKTWLKGHIEWAKLVLAAHKKGKGWGYRRK